MLILIRILWSGFILACWILGINAYNNSFKTDLTGFIIACGITVVALSVDYWGKQIHNAIVDSNTWLYKIVKDIRAETGKREDTNSIENSRELHR